MHYLASMARPVNEIIQNIASGFPGYLEFRYHNRRMRSLGVRKGELNENSFKQIEGAGIRVLSGGSWGFASTSDLTESLAKALEGLTRGKHDGSG